MFDRNKFRAKVIENGLTMEEVANKLDINIATLYRKMSGQSDFTRNEMQLLRNLLNLNTKTAEDIFFASELA